jgi:hypothetical protein
MNASQVLSLSLKGPKTGHKLRFYVTGIRYVKNFFQQEIFVAVLFLPKFSLTGSFRPRKKNNPVRK